MKPRLRVTAITVSYRSDHALPRARRRYDSSVGRADRPCGESNYITNRIIDQMCRTPGHRRRINLPTKRTLGTPVHPPNSQLSTAALNGNFFFSSDVFVNVSAPPCVLAERRPNLGDGDYASDSRYFNLNRNSVAGDLH